MKREDEEIINLYWERNEMAISRTQTKYGAYLLKISNNILMDLEDSKENVNDTYLKAWNTIPPQRPTLLQTYLGKLCRNKAIDTYRRKHAKKRQGSQYELCIDELAEVLEGGSGPEQEMMTGELSEIINSYVKSLSPNKRAVFLGRYFYMDSVKEIADYSKLTVANVKTSLSRMRRELAQILEKEGYVQ